MIINCNKNEIISYTNSTHIYHKVVVLSAKITFWVIHSFNLAYYPLNILISILAVFNNLKTDCHTYMLNTYYIRAYIDQLNKRDTLILLEIMILNSWGLIKQKQELNYIKMLISIISDQINFFLLILSPILLINH
jgi:hypothetical protein